jgi:outer membrane protein OmpA-like peptidoglycan-associated protein
MKIKNIRYTLLLSILFFQGYSQKGSIEKAEKQYDNYAYVDATTTYEKLAKKGYKDEKMFQQLANAYYFKAELPKAVKWYDELFLEYPAQQPEYYYRYAQALKSIGNYAKADKMLEQFSAKNGNDSRGLLFKDNKSYLEEIKANSGRFNVSDAGINSPFSDYGSSFLEDKLVFASERDTGGIAKKVFKWNNQAFTNLYYTEVKANGEIVKPERFIRKINSKFNESSAVFTQDKKTMYFTRNNFIAGKKGKDADNKTLLKLYKATLINGVWDDVIELPFNSNEYSVAHPALSVDEDVLYFASDMPGTLGQSDLFKVDIKADGTYGAPINLGSQINTEGRETFPYISDENELYFASDGHPGLGGLDVFVVRIEDNVAYNKVQNVGAPVNSNQDDFAFIINSDTRKGYFTSNRVGGKGSDDIYKFTEHTKLKYEQTITGTVTDLETGAILPNAKVSLYDENFKLVKEVPVDEKGQYALALLIGKKYYVRGDKDNYLTKEVAVNLRSFSESTDYPIVLEKDKKTIAVGTDLAKTLDIPIVYFDLDKSDIRKDAAFELAKVVVVMQQFPEMKIDVRSHTDSRQSAEYNQKLSDKRAKATIAWLVKNGIDSTRLIGKGYGESELVNQCADGVKCSEKEHQANRRSEFIIVSMK